MTIKHLGRAAALLLLASHTVSCAGRPRVPSPPTASSPKGQTKPAAPRKTETGIASIYRDHRTASGQPYRASALAAAHRTLPMGTRVKVTALRTGRSTIVRINDRGPYIRGRIIDLTPAAATAIGLTPRMGITKVEIQRLP